MTDRFVGPLPVPEMPEQAKRPASWCPRWDAFDVPRLFDMVKRDGNRSALDQIGGFEQLAQALEDYYRLWRTKRDELAAAWISPAAEQVLLRLDIYGNDLLADGACARQTAYALDRTVSSLVEAKTKIAPLMEQWTTVTGDWRPEWWDHAAERLNQEARDVMTKTDVYLAQARPYIMTPDALTAFRRDDRIVIVDPEPKTGPHRTADAEGGPTATPRLRVPPVPGYEPVGGQRTTPELAASTGAPQFVAAVPGQPVSMLPIPPGSPYAPFGGAYILPGPGVGRAGYVVPMPQNPGGPRPFGGSRTLMPPTPMTGAVGGAGMVPMPFAGGGPGGGGGSHGAIYRRPTVQWHNDKGVPPVIRIDDEDYVPDRPTPKQEEEFRDWFSDLAYPWRAEFKSSEGAQVTIRTVQQ